MMADDDDLNLDVAAPKKSGGMSKMLIIGVLAVVLMGGTVGLTVMLVGGDKKAHVDEETEEDEEEEEDEHEEKAHKKKKKKKKKKRKKKKGKHKKSKLKTPFYLELPKAIVVNLDGSSGVRFLQISVALMVYDEAHVELLKKHLPVIRHSLVLLFSSQNFSELQSVAGKKKLQADALKTIREELEKLIGDPIVEAIYLPSIVGQ
ncbi:hypothetical protein MNBD_GAMMA12-3038 [hydrothermal vent metagenome]|uniref:Vps72/YL1 N-terminal domain-containing protein n=1 Tax=hydrothermal vent metagenome TaxID=652676 RepID=A0A3B0Y5F2_9ZZZZ